MSSRWAAMRESSRGLGAARALIAGSVLAPVLRPFVRGAAAVGRQVGAIVRRLPDTDVQRPVVPGEFDPVLQALRDGRIGRLAVRVLWIDWRQSIAGRTLAPFVEMWREADAVAILRGAGVALGTATLVDALLTQLLVRVPEVAVPGLWVAPVAVAVLLVAVPDAIAAAWADRRRRR